MKRTLGSVAGAVVFFGLGVGCVGLLGGCGDADQTGGKAAELSPDMEKKTNEMLSGYGKQYNEKFRAEKAKKTAK